MGRKMKDSGLAWVGDIPSHWNLVPNKYLMQKKRNLCEKWNGENVLSLTMNGVVVRDLENPSGKMPATFDGYQYLRKGNLLMCLFDIDVTPRCVGRVRDDGVTSPAYSVFELEKGADLNYFYYYYLMLDYTKVLLSFAKNLRHSLTEEQLGMIKVPVPPTGEQIQIAEWLDEKCGEVDQLINEAKETIIKYKKWKVSVIYEAVTKGLNPDVTMKDSGVLHIGNTPSHWDLIPNKYIMKKKKNICEKWAGEDVMSLTMNGVVVRDLENPSGKMPSTFDGYQYINEGELLMCLFDIDVTPRCVGRVKQNGVTSPAYSSFVLTEKADLDYYYYYYLMLDNTKELLTYAKNLRHSLTEEQLGLLKVPVPPKTEQVEIARFLDRKIGDIDAIIKEKEALIEKLEEYKKSLVFEAVTGKREVI